MSDAEVLAADRGAGTAPDGSSGSASDAAVAAAVARLSQLGGLPLAAHPDVYQGIHAELQDALADIDDA